MDDAFNAGNGITAIFDFANGSTLETMGTPLSRKLFGKNVGSLWNCLRGRGLDSEIEALIEVAGK